MVWGSSEQIRCREERANLHESNPNGHFVVDARIVTNVEAHIHGQNEVDCELHHQKNQTLSYTLSWSSLARTLSHFRTFPAAVLFTLLSVSLILTYAACLSTYVRRCLFCSPCSDGALWQRCGWIQLESLLAPVSRRSTTAIAAATERTEADDRHGERMGRGRRARQKSGEVTQGDSQIRSFASRCAPNTAIAAAVTTLCLLAAL